ncbi:hypothetical protein [Deinococcus carri]|uniref:MmyB family transcriptional regulator n=1 Tax=Deinococcus carri TaxID=1211323 RepID=UPI003CD08217
MGVSPTSRSKERARDFSFSSRNTPEPTCSYLYCATGLEFAALWQRHPVENCITGTKSFRHPQVGEFDFEFEALLLPDGSGDRLLTYTVNPRSSAETALRRLVQSLQVPG